MKTTLTQVKRYTKDKDGHPLKTRDGKPYERLNVQVESYGEKWISGFGNSRNKNWQAGDEVEIEVTENGQYLNFSMPKPVVMGGMSEADKEILQQLAAGQTLILAQLKKIEGLLSIPQDDAPMPDFEQ